MELIIFFFALVLSSVIIKLFSNKMGWKVSWLLPVVLGFVIAVLITVFFSMNQKQIQVTEDTVQVTADPINTVPSKSTVNADLSNVEAYEFAQELYKKIESDEKFLEDAFELKEYNTLSKYVSNDWPEYTERPHRFYPKAQVTYSSKYFPEGKSVAPYTACDTAFRDLYLYASAMEKLLRDDTATNRQTYRTRKENYLKSKARCKARVDMTYEQALDAADKE